MESRVGAEDLGTCSSDSFGEEDTQIEEPFPPLNTTGALYFYEPLQDQVVSRQVGQSANWLVGQSANRLIGKSASRLIGSLSRIPSHKLGQMKVPKLGQMKVPSHKLGQTMNPSIKGQTGTMTRSHRMKGQQEEPPFPRVTRGQLQAQRLVSR